MYWGRGAKLTPPPPGRQGSRPPPLPPQFGWMAKLEAGFPSLFRPAQPPPPPPVTLVSYASPSPPWAVLPVSVLFTIVSVPWLKIAPPKPAPPPPVPPPFDPVEPALPPVNPWAVPPVSV